jgi:hypothetical protein
MSAMKVQACLSKHSALIRTRLGLHWVKTDGSSDGGLIVLELKPGASSELEKSLRAMKDVVVKKMTF